jgi:hypothetical protein
MSEEELSDLSELRFHNMVVPESNYLVKSVLNNVIKSACVGSGDQAAYTLERNLQQVEKLFQTFFVEGDERIFLSETLLMQAKEERDKKLQRILVEKSMQHLITNPARVKLDDVIPVLMEQANITGVLDICLRQAAALHQ